jgi:hypothetical protein
MFISSWFPWTHTRQHKGWTWPPHSPGVHRRSTPLALEQLEDRTLPSGGFSYPIVSNATQLIADHKYAKPSGGLPYPTAANATQLIADINAANLAGGSNTITLAPGTTFPLAGVYLPNGEISGLPVIAANDKLTIQGNGDTLQCYSNEPGGMGDFRLFEVASGAALTLENMTLQGGGGVN